MSRRAAVLAVLLLSCRTTDPLAWEPRAIERAMAAGDCRAVDRVLFMFEATDEQREFVDECWRRRQVEIIQAARARGNCDGLQNLPGMYPHATFDADVQRYVYHCWMRHRHLTADICIGLRDIANHESIPGIVSLLRHYEPERDDHGRLHLIDTAHTCLGALRTATAASDAEIREMAKEWSPAWRAWAEAQP